MKVNFIEAQYIGRSRYAPADGKARWYMNFIYKSEYVEGYACFSFPIFDGDRYKNADDFIMKDNYKIAYHRENGFVQVDMIEKL